MNSAITLREAAPDVSSGRIASRPERRSATVSWASVAAWGAGLIELALGAGSVLIGDRAARGAGIVLITLGVAGLVWGVATLGRGRIVVPRSGVAGALVGVGAVAFALASDPARTSVIATASAIVLLIAVALACGSRLRRERTGGVDAATPSLSVLIASAVIVAGIVTPVLGSTEAGRLAPSHSDHGIVDPGHH